MHARTWIIYPGILFFFRTLYGHSRQIHLILLQVLVLRKCTYIANAICENEVKAKKSAIVAFSLVVFARILQQVLDSGFRVKSSRQYMLESGVKICIYLCLGTFR